MWLHNASRFPAPFWRRDPCTSYEARGLGVMAGTGPTLGGADMDPDDEEVGSGSTPTEKKHVGFRCGVCEPVHGLPPVRPEIFRSAKERPVLASGEIFPTSSGVEKVVTALHRAVPNLHSSGPTICWSLARSTIPASIGSSPPNPKDLRFLFRIHLRPRCVSEIEDAETDRTGLCNRLVGGLLKGGRQNTLA
ncbi:hypothetical protein FIBSPDRAFT_566780 [Athelia psychrophila]|uniref:Uncharacterized protein n=1 Tax=Athelia psychrophila TaxID=1759441 RepID=A0A166HZE3_9AGAM|nr:hypothetical protein FIBSPDRAFT_566780 [Fibularhizoctonia sp. CBS 109695]